MGIGLALNYGHRLANLTPGAAKNKVIPGTGGAVAVFDPFEATTSGGWQDWSAMMAEIVKWQRSVPGGVNLQARTAVVLVITRESPVPSSIIVDLPGGDYELAGPLVLVGGPDVAAVWPQLDEVAGLPTTILRAGEDGDVSFSWTGPKMPDNAGPRFELVGVYLHSTQTAPLWSIGPRAGSSDTAGTLDLKVTRSRLSVGAASGAMFDVDSSGQLSILGDEAQMLRDDTLGSVGLAARVVQVAAGGICFARLNGGSFVGDLALAAQTGGFLSLSHSTSDRIGHIDAADNPALVGGTALPQVRPIVHPIQCRNNDGANLVNALILPAAVALIDAGDNFSDGDTIGLSIAGVPDLTWSFVAGAPASPDEVQVQGSGTATIAELVDRINLNPASPYTAALISGDAVNPHIVLVMKVAGPPPLNLRPLAGWYVDSAIDVEAARFDLRPDLGAALSGNEYGGLRYSTVSASVPGDARVDAFGPGWGEVSPADPGAYTGKSQQLPDGSVARLALPSVKVGGRSTYRDLRLVFGDWQPADSYASESSVWAGVPPDNMTDAMTRIAALVQTLNGGTPIP